MLSLTASGGDSNMIYRFMTPTTIVNGMLLVRGKVYNVDYLYQSRNGWMWFGVSEIDSPKGTKIAYCSWNIFEAEWQLMEEVYDMKDWKYITDWNKKNLTCSFCGDNRSVKYEVVVKDVNGKKRHVPCCNECLVRMILARQDA